MENQKAKTSRIVTITINPTIDLSAKAEHVVEERKLRCNDSRFDPGGGGLNVARAIKNLGGTTTALYSSGGPVGKILENLIEQEGLDHRPIEIRE